MGLASSSIAGSTSPLLPSPYHILSLPAEVMDMVLSHLSPDDLSRLRCACRYFHERLHEAFAKHHFSKLYVLPTAPAYKTLIQIATSPRLAHHVQELHLCSSVYRHRGDTDASTTVCHYGRVPVPYIVEEGYLPYPYPALPWQLAANDSVEFLRTGNLQKELIVALTAMRIRRVAISSFPDSNLPLKEATRLQEQTGIDPLEMVRNIPAWDYSCPDMSTSMGNAVFAAVTLSATILDSLSLNRIQDGAMDIFSQITDKHVGRLFHNLKTLAFTDGLSESPKSQYERLKHLSNENYYSDSWQSAIAKTSIRSQALNSFVQHLPALRSLHLKFPVSRLIRGAHSPIGLHHILLYFHPEGLQELSLGTFETLPSNLMTFLTTLRSTLRSLTLSFELGDRFMRDQELKDMFSQLDVSLSLHKLVVNLDGRFFEASGEENVKTLIAWLVENALIEDEEDEVWVQFIESGSSEDFDDWVLKRHIGSAQVTPRVMN